MCPARSGADAVDNAIAGDVISVTTTQSYAGQHVTITSKTIGVTGGSQCGLVNMGRLPTATSTAAKVAIVGDGAHPVFYVDGGGVTFSNLDISGGLGAAKSLVGGGGIAFMAAGGTLTLNNVELHGNSGGNGGGGAIYGDGSLVVHGVYIHDNTVQGGGGGISSFIGHVELVLVDDAAQPIDISANQSRNSGGGIYASGETDLQAVATAPGTISIHDNQAGDPVQNIAANGGGIEFSGAAFADIALPGATGLYGNKAAFGAAIAVGATNNNSAVVRVFSTDAQFPTDIESNQASAYGGAIYVGGAGSTTHSTACLFDTALSANDASQAGGAIAVGDGGRLFVNPDSNAECTFDAVAALGAVHCDADVAACNTLRMNMSSTGATVDWSGAAIVGVRRLQLLQNSGVAVLRTTDANGGSVTFSDCLLARNSVSGSLVALQGAPATFDGCTFADDTIGGTVVLAQNSGLTLTRSIVAETKAVFDAGVTAQYDLFNDPKLPTDSTALYARPAFVDAGSGDYHLSADSPAIDFAPDGMASPSGDFDRQPREVDLAGVTDMFGPRDLGPYEYQVGGVLDRIFLGTFD